MSFSRGLEIQIVHGVNSVEPDAWDSLRGDGLFVSRRWYQYGEAVLARDRPVYVLAHWQGEPIARATFWLTRHIPLPGVSRALRLMLRTVLTARPVLLCSAPLAAVPGLTLPPDAALRAQALQAIADAAQAWSRQHRVSFIVFDNLTADAAHGWPPGYAALEVPGRARNCVWPGPTSTRI